METTKVTIYATDETAEKFVLFQQHFDTFNTLVDADVFEQKNAAVTLHFDHLGILQLIQRADVLYSKKHLQKERSVVK